MIDDTLLKIIHLKHFEGGIIDKIMVPMIRENAKKTQREKDNFLEKFQTYYKAILDKPTSYNKKKTTPSWLQKNFTYEKLPSTVFDDNGVIIVPFQERARLKVETFIEQKKVSRCLLELKMENLPVPRKFNRKTSTVLKIIK
jgi:hypothetical protein